MTEDDPRADIPPRNGEQDEAPRDARDRSGMAGANARPLDDTIAQTGPGLPDDSSAPVEIDPAEERRIADRIRTIGTSDAGRDSGSE
ncbi:hypothetical protein [Rhodoplanes roseus]|uniref:Uncharacterized protein n=1 Tax=Rhodoplanes roseus TaxID=29409 RepID=A0A327KRP5_9BRAD|nr:hypothetical protein [Rhodoplanes roseus]RAI40957.1 hypothetical protein CH341_22725 [Rhodoplanes roseus]